MIQKMLLNKIIDKSNCQIIAEQLRSEGKKIVFTNGCFDILHPGHVEYLLGSKELGDILIVGVNTDSSVKKLNKGVNRPINSLDTRMFVLAGLSSTDYIVPFDEETPIELIKTISPDILVKGGDYAISQIVGFEYVTSYGGDVFCFPFKEGYSTTDIINKINSNQ